MTYSRNSAQRRVSQIRVLPAPIGGLNDVDPLASMGEEFCIQMINWIPGNAALQARQGYREWVTNLNGPVRTIMPYIHMNGDVFTFAATDHAIYDVTWQTAAPVIQFEPIGNGYFKFINFGTVGNQYLIAVNGQNDESLIYDGIIWKRMIETATPVNPGEISGVNPNKFSNVASYKRRLWFVEESSMTAWYLPVDALGGEAKPFYLTSVFKRGGRLLYIVDWSVDGGDGLDNKLIFVSNLGEIAVYSGDDPDNAETFRVEAVFYAAAPIGEKSFVEFGGDVYMTTVLGILPLSKILMGMMSQSPNSMSVSKRINRTLNRIVTSRSYASNWELYNLPVLQALVLVIPAVGTTPAIQFVMNTSTGAWTRLDLPVNCGALVRGDFYFGTVDGKVMLYGGGNYKDNVKLDGSGGESVICSLFSAYSYMGDPTTLKHWKLIRPIFQSDQPVSYLVKLNVDYDTAALAGNPQPPGQEQENPIWDVAIWDQAFWSSSFTVFRPWIGVSAMGFASALLMKAATNDVTTLVAIEYVYEAGGAI